MIRRSPGATIQVGGVELKVTDANEYAALLRNPDRKIRQQAFEARIATYRAQGDLFAYALFEKTRSANKVAGLRKFADSIDESYDGLELTTELVDRVLKAFRDKASLATRFQKAEAEYQSDPSAGEKFVALFVAAWWSEHGTHEVKVAHLYGLVDDDVSLPLGEGSDQSRKLRLGQILTLARDRMFDLSIAEGESSNTIRVRIRRGAMKQRSYEWKLEEMGKPVGTKSVSLCKDSPQTHPETHCECNVNTAQHLDGAESRQSESSESPADYDDQVDAASGAFSWCVRTPRFEPPSSTIRHNSPARFGNPIRLQPQLAGHISRHPPLRPPLAISVRR